MKNFRIVMLLGCLLVLILSGCSNTMKAIENKDLAVQAKMSDTIFLEAEQLAEAQTGSNGSIYVRVTNTSDFQEINFKTLLIQKLTDMGYNVTHDPRNATYQVTANLLYLNEAKEGMDMGSVLGSGFGGALVGASVAGLTGSSWHNAGMAGLAGGLIASGVDGAAGAMWKVEEYIGITDVQIKETVAGGVEGVQMASLENGTSTTTTTSRNVASDKQEYRTRIAVNAKQTNIDREEACNVIADRMASQIAGMFIM